MKDKKEMWKNTLDELCLIKEGWVAHDWMVDFIRLLLSAQKQDLKKKVEKMPKYDLSKSGVGGEFYLKREAIIKILEE